MRSPRLHPGRHPHLLHARAGRRRARSAARLRARRAARLRLRRLRGQAVDPAAGEVGRRPTRTGPRPPRPCAPALEAARASTTCVDEGGGAFYGPKIDVDVRDAIGRSWQLSTIQLDFNLPERFGLEYIGADGSPPHAGHDPPRAVRLDRAVLRRAARALRRRASRPGWRPVQVRVLPVARRPRRLRRRRSSTRSRPWASGPTSVDADEKLGNRIRKAKVEKLPYVLVVGDDDVATRTVGVNPRGGEVERGRPARRLRRPCRRRRSPTFRGI